MTFQEAIVTAAKSEGKLVARCIGIPELGVVRWGALGWTSGDFGCSVPLPAPQIIEMQWEVVPWPRV